MHYILCRYSHMCVKYCQFLINKEETEAASCVFKDDDECLRQP